MIFLYLIILMSGPGDRVNTLWLTYIFDENVFIAHLAILPYSPFQIPTEGNTALMCIFSINFCLMLTKIAMFFYVELTRLIN